MIFYRKIKDRHIDLELLPHKIKQQFSKDDFKVSFNQKTKDELSIAICYPQHDRVLNLNLQLVAFENDINFKVSFNSILESIYYFFMGLALLLILVGVTFKVSLIIEYIGFTEKLIN